MRLLILDDERLALRDLADTVQKVCPDGELECFEKSAEALDAARERRFDVAFLDVTLPGRNGLELSKELKEIYPGINIIFVTGYSEFAVDAFSLNASGYILKPARAEAVWNALENLRTPVQHDCDRLRVQCFGNFEVFYNGKSVNFRRSLSKEILAYLVNLRGASATTNELCAALFEEDTPSNKHYLRNLLSDLRNTLESCGAKGVFLSRRNNFAIDPERIDCDYYRYLNDDPAAANSYAGEYMKQYSWAEMTNGTLASRERDRFGER